MADAPRKLVVGLGNPGPEYEATRHNVGFRILDRVAADNRFPDFHRKGLGLETVGRLNGDRVALLKPLTFMNLSGGLVARRLADLGLAPSELLVCYDELALPLGRLRLRPGGSGAGHNGVQSVIDALGTQEFPRLRLGVAPEGRFTDQVRFLLSPFRKAELAAVGEGVERAARAVECYCREGIRAAMNRFNAPPEA
ncbi:MAG TPA: aminoacyl-tRNA hydrolase [Gemmatimonadota bacterium]